MGRQQERVTDFPNTAEQIESLRGLIQRGRHVPVRVAEWLAGLAAEEQDDAVDALFELDPWIEDGPELPQGCVPYLGAPVSSVCRLIKLVPMDTRTSFVDLGCGVGRAALLVNVLTGARVFGVDVQSKLVERAKLVAQRLGLSSARFYTGDVCSADCVIPDGTVYFLYCPFGRGRIERLLERMGQQCRSASMCVACLHTELPRCDWLSLDDLVYPEWRVYRTLGR